MNDHSKINSLQKEKCILAGSPESYPDEILKIGIALQTKGKQPVTGMRAHPENGTAGWYIWAGEYSEDPDLSQYTLATSQMYGPHSCRTWLLHQVIDLSLTMRVTRIFGMSQLLRKNKNLLQNSALQNFIPIKSN